MAEITDQNTAEFVATVADASAGATSTFNAAEGFDNLAVITGGRAVRGLNDVAHQISVVVDLSRSFYTIGYSPTSVADTATKYRKIRVDCKRPGLTIRTRDGYYAEENRQQLSAAPASVSYDLSTAAESTVPLNGLRVSITPSNSVSAAPDSFIVHVAADNLTWKLEDDGTATASVAVLAAYLDRKGKLLTHTLHGMTAHARAGVNLREPRQDRGLCLYRRGEGGEGEDAAVRRARRRHRTDGVVLTCPLPTSLAGRVGVPSKDGGGLWRLRPSSL